MRNDFIIAPFILHAGIVFPTHSHTPSRTPALVRSAQHWLYLNQFHWYLSHLWIKLLLGFVTFASIKLITTPIFYRQHSINEHRVLSWSQYDYVRNINQIGFQDRSCGSRDCRCISHAVDFEPTVLEVDFALLTSLAARIYLEYIDRGNK